MTDFKDTIQLPKTDFPMRANLINREPAVYQLWANYDIYKRMAKNRVNSPVFTLHDGPPYANGNIHIGHALNKILKDFIVKHRYFNGYAVRWTPGWDCHGLPIERGASKRLEKISQPAEIRSECRKYADEFVANQKDQFQKLGLAADWNNPYTTHDKEFEAEIYHKLCMLAKNGFLYERQKPVLWSWKERTALASTEVEYKDQECNSIYVAMPIRFKHFGPDTKIVVWTTTPWTLPANTAVAINPNELYILTKKNLIIAKKRYEALKDVVGEKTVEFQSDFLYESQVSNPVSKHLFQSKLVFSDKVDVNTGSGCIHIAPGHGEVDYEIGVENNLPVLMPVDSAGKYTAEIRKLTTFLNEGQHVFDADAEIIKALKTKNLLLQEEKINHRYPFCERSKTPIIFRATKQWFVKMDDLKNKALEQIEDVKFFPESGKESLELMIKTRPDWCVSRQRVWGVPIAFFKHKKTGRYVLGDDVLTHIENVFRQHSSDAWFTFEIKDLLPENYRYKPEELEKVTDVLDVWFDSGSTWHILQGKNKNGNYPADLYLEGRDQYRGWFSSSLLLGVACADKSPFKEVVCHGFVVDGGGFKMAKSVGNVISPDLVAKKYGVEILRMWAATSDYTKELRIDDTVLDGCNKEYGKLRNTLRFLLGNVAGVNVNEISGSTLKPIDKWICSKAETVFGEVDNCFFKYQFAKGMHKLMDFVYHDLSGLYMNSVKDRMYCGSPEDRLGGQHAMAIILRSMTGLLAPILTYTCNEVLEHSPKWENTETIFDHRLVKIETLSHTPFDETIAKEIILELHNVTDNLKKEMQLKNPLELVVQGPDLTALGLNNQTMEEWLVVSGYGQSFDNDNILGEFQVGEYGFKVFRSQMNKCPRCWKYSATDELCKRCSEVVK